MSRIAHVDMDAFYVSVELQRRPELRGLPVVVAGSGPRAVVTTASYEARRFGVFSATPAERARRLCPDAVFIPPDFEAYRARSQRGHGGAAQHVERVEVVGLDEAYLDLTGLDRHRSAAARASRRPCKAETGLTLLDRHRPQQAGGEGRVGRREAGRLPRAHRREARDCASPRPRPASSRASARRRSARLEELGIATLGRLGATPDEQLTAVVRPAARPPPRGARALRGRPRHRDRARGQVGVARDHLRPRPARPRAARAGARPAHRRAVRRRSRREERRGRTIGIKVRFDDFSTVTSAPAASTRR